MSLEIRKFNPETPDVIVVDGLWGSGKSLIAPIVASLRGVGGYRIDPNVEYLTTLRTLGKIDQDAYGFLVLNGFILGHYHNVIGREVNLRTKDDSSVFKNGAGFRTLMKLPSVGGDSALAEAQRRHSAYFLMTHLLTSVAPTLMGVAEGKVRLINIRRNPLFMVDHWANYLATFERSREATLSISWEGSKVPWFAAEWAGEFLEATILERSLLGIARCAAAERLALAKLGDNRDPVLSMRFDSVLTDPSGTVLALEEFLGRSATHLTGTQLRKLRLGPGRLPIHRAPKKRPDLSGMVRKDLAERYRAQARSSVWDEFFDCVEDYERRPNYTGGSD